MNTPLGGSFHYHIDIGNNDTIGNAILTGPMDRVSAPMEINNTTYRELKFGLVYFNLKSQQLNDASTIHVKARFKDNFQAENIFKLEPQNKKGWEYLWREIYVPFYENNLTDMELIYDDIPTRIYSTRPRSGTIHNTLYDNFNKKTLNSSSTGKVISNFLDEVPHGTIIATNMELENSFADIQEKHNGGLSIDTQIREAHTFYTYIDNELLDLTVTKQDLNWYNGSDELNITVYTSGGTHVGTVIIPDDGIINITDKYGIDQSETMSIPDLKKGVYKIDLRCGSDLIIKRISINQNKLVAANRLYILNNDTIFFNNYNEREIRFQTYHWGSVPQNILIKGTSRTQTVNLSKEQQWFNITTCFSIITSCFSIITSCFSIITSCFLFISVNLAFAISSLSPSSSVISPRIISKYSNSPVASSNLTSRCSTITGYSFRVISSINELILLLSPSQMTFTSYGLRFETMPVSFIFRAARSTTSLYPTLCTSPFAIMIALLFIFFTLPNALIYKNLIYKTETFH